MKFKGTKGDWNVSNVKDMHRMFQYSPLENTPPKWYKN